MLSPRACVRAAHRPPDRTAQLVRLYFRYIEGEGKYGKRQQLVLTDIDKETRRIQAMGGTILASERRTNFQQWLNRDATKDDKQLCKAAFVSLQHYMKAHGEHSMPWLVQALAQLPVLGSLVELGYKAQHDLWLKAKAKRNRMLRDRMLRRSVSTPSRSRSSTSSPGRASRPDGPARSSLQAKSGRLFRGTSRSAGVVSQ